MNDTLGQRTVRVGQTYQSPSGPWHYKVKKLDRWEWVAILESGDGSLAAMRMDETGRPLKEWKFIEERK